MPKPEYDIWLTKQNEEATTCRLYKRRWFMLLLFVLYAASTVVHWSEYSSIEEAVVRFYGVSSDAVERSWTVFALVFIIMTAPGWNLLEKHGCRRSVITGMAGSCTAAWLKVLSTTTDRFWGAISAQAVAGGFAVVMVVAIPQLAANWFGANEVSTACGIGISGVFLGCALGYALPKLFVNATQSIAEIQTNLMALNLAISIVSTIILILLIRYMEEKPPLPPSHAQMRIAYGKQEVANKVSIKRFLCMRSYSILIVSYSIIMASMCTLLKHVQQIIVTDKLYPQYHVNLIYLTVTLSGMLGCILSGIILDKYKIFRAVAFGTYMVTFAAMVSFTVALMEGPVLVYITAAILGLSMSGMLTAGFQFAIELTYPEPQTIACGILVAVAQWIDIIFKSLYGYLLHQSGNMVANLSISGALLIGGLLILLIPGEYKRQTAPVKALVI